MRYDGSFFQFPLSTEGWAKLILVSSFLFFLLLEALFPSETAHPSLRASFTDQPRHDRDGLRRGGLVVRSSALAVSDWAAAHHLGL